MFPDIPSITMPDTIAVVAFEDSVVLRRMVTTGLEDFRRMSVDGMHILQFTMLDVPSGMSSDAVIEGSGRLPGYKAEVLCNSPRK